MESTVNDIPMSRLICFPDNGLTPKNSYCIFRTVVSKAGELDIFCRDFYELFVNETWIARGPVWSADPLLYFDRFHLAEKNSFVAIRIHRRTGVPELCFRMRDMQGRRIDPEWECRSCRAYLPDTPLNVGNVGYSEFHDFSADEELWFSRTWTDGNFTAPISAGTIEPDRLHPRPIPKFETESVEPVAITPDRDGGIIADFGRMVFGRIAIEGVSRNPNPVHVQYIESLDSGWAHTEGRREMYEDRLYHVPNEFRWESFNPRGFRYVAVSDGVEVTRVRAEESLYPAVPIGKFECSDPDLNRIWDISAATVKVCMSDMYVDCPHRDQAQWMDAFFSAKVALTLFGTTDLTRKCILQHAICSFRDGRFLSPSISGTTFMPDYALILVLFIRWYYEVTGDRELLTEVSGNLKAALNLFDRLRGDDGLIGGISIPYFLYLDNTSDLRRTGKSAALNALYFGALNAAAEIFDALGEDGKPYRDEAARILPTYRRVFEKDDGLLRDSNESRDFELRNINFFCEFNSYQGSAGLAEFLIDSDIEKQISLFSGAYGEYRIFLNDRQVYEDLRQPSWSRPAPCYELNSTVLPLRRGRNTIRFEVRHNLLKWDLFLHSPQYDFVSGHIFRGTWGKFAASEEKVPFFTRPWYPPAISQTTLGYAAYCGIPIAPEVLKRSLPPEYKCNYSGIRTPAFCRETADRNELKAQVLPCNTPGVAFFYLSALFDAGLSLEALSWMRMAWGVMLQKQAVNTWEEWDDNASLCHAWGSVPAYLFGRYILGVREESYNRAVINLVPDLCGLEYAAGKVALPTGQSISVRLEKMSGKTRVIVRYPQNWTLNYNLSRIENPEFSSETD